MEFWARLDGCGKSLPHRVSNAGPARLQTVIRSTALIGRPVRRMTETHSVLVVIHSSSLLMAANICLHRDPVGEVMPEIFQRFVEPVASVLSTTVKKAAESSEIFVDII